MMSTKKIKSESTLAKERFTSQKQIILEYLAKHPIHPTVDDVYRAVRRKLPRISLGTVYRNLNQLSIKGGVCEVFGPVKRYDYNDHEHAHFVCLNCNQVFDFENNLTNESGLRRKLKQIGQVSSYQAYFWGTCHQCAKPAKGNFQAKN